MPQAETFSELQIARDRDGKVVELLRNDMEVVCLAFSTSRQCFVELHVFHSDDDGGGGPDPEIFVRQARAAADIQHPQSTQVLDFGEDDGACFYLSDFGDGELLEDYLYRCAPLSESIALELVLNAARGLSAYTGAMPVLAGMDLLQSRVRIDHRHAQSLTVKVGGYSFGSRKAEMLAAAGVHEYYVRSLAEVLIWAVTGRQISVDALTDADAAHWSVPSLALLEALDGNRPSVRSLDSAVAAIERTLTNLHSDAKRLDPLLDSQLPRLPLEPNLVSLEELHSYLSDDYPLIGDPLNPRTPLRLTTIDTELQQKGTIQLLPIDDVLPPEITEKFQRAMGKGTPLNHPNLIRLLAHWPSENAGFIIEEDAGEITLEDVIAWKGSFSPEEAVLVLIQLESACTQAGECGLKADLRGSGQVVVHFLDKETGAHSPLPQELRIAPLSTWPAFRVRVRTFPTFLSLLSCPPVLARPSRKTGDSEAMAFAWWTLQMLGEQAEGHPRLNILVNDVINDKAGALIQTGADFVRAFRGLVECPQASHHASGRPQSIATNGSRMTGLKGRRSLRATRAVPRHDTRSEKRTHADWQADADGEYLADADIDTEATAPGFAEALFHSGGIAPPPMPQLRSRFDDADRADSDSHDLDEDELMDTHDQEPASSLWLVIIVVLIALLLAAFSAQLSGNAFWLH
ncbi:MAG: hypothetical protein O3C21_14745 [Verrucomicrobia bacterium]|nr:hypothetical protein [Verrucomicrobiota bacterium]